ncbi:hypothetical protein [Desertibaculum subflavum]|uniref:hypothetical protein n=1 Tax=Desertibaculum subflavum TaxID=2268458 RepID=UPI000E669C4B
MQQPTAGFAVPVTGALKRRGIRRREARVTLAGTALQIVGDEGGVLAVTPDRLRRLRSGWEETKRGPSYETRLWLVGEAKPVTLFLKDRAYADYARVIRGFAGGLPLDRLETGTTPAGALFLPVAMGLLSLAAIGISLFVITEEPWWGRMLVPIIPVGVFLYGLHTLRRMWPKPAADRAAFDRAVMR